MKRRATRIISMLLAVTMSVAVLPVRAFAEAAQEPAPQTEPLIETPAQEPAPQAEALAEAPAAEEASLQFQTNGGTFAAGYTAPTRYPAETLPGAAELTKPGYAFAGWYDNADFAGSALAAIAAGDYTGSVVLYAKWTPRYYWVDIPATATATENGGAMQVTVEGGGFYPQDKVGVSVSSANGWKLKNGLLGVGYTLAAGTTVLKNGDTVAEMGADKTKMTQPLALALTEKPMFAGVYQDTLQFDVSFADTKYTITYEPNGGTLEGRKRGPDGNLLTDEQGNSLTETITSQTLAAGTSLGALPMPGKADGSFLGWCYDQELTRYVDSSDRLLGDITLYAAYAAVQPLAETKFSTFARKVDADPATFVISVSDSAATPLTAEEVRAACTLTNASNANRQEAVTVTAGEAGTFTIKAENGWMPGADYLLTLGNSALYFTGFDTTIREYNFNIYKAEVLNVHLKEDIRYLREGELSDLTVGGAKVDTVSVAAMTVSADGTAQDGTKTTGTFTYSGEPLLVGQQIGVYAGDVMPDLTKAVDDSAEISFFEILAADGTSYRYRGAKAEDVLFVPDVLPLSQGADLDGDAANRSVTVDAAALRFAGESEMEQALGLNTDTTVDKGDYLSFYTGSSPANGTSAGYALIDTVTSQNNQYVLTYTMVSYEQMQAAMDAYSSTPMSGDELLEGQDRQEIEQSVAQQAIDSGFAQDVANEMGELAMRTESYEELETLVQENLGADSVTVLAADSLPQESGAATFAAGSKVEVKLDHVTARLTTQLQNFGEQVDGLRLTLDIGAKITLHLNDDADLEMVISAKFEQEARVDIDVDAKAEWSWWGIFPYISEYRVNAAVEVYEYTGIELNLRIKTAEGEGGDESDSDAKRNELNKKVEGIAKELKGLMEKGTTFLSSDSDVTTRLEEIGSTDDLAGLGKDDFSIAKGLGERYAEMLEDDADWVKLFSKELTSQHTRLLLIIDIEFKLEFAVTLNVNISMGLTYWYKNAKKYIYSVAVFSRQVTNNTIDLCEEQYEFTAYAVGTIGIRAGLTVSLDIGLFTTKLDSVGISAEAGGYIQVWGYLYYWLHYQASGGQTSGAMGAIYLELGVYLEIKFKAQAFAGTFSYNPTLYEKQWPLYAVGAKQSVVDFNYTSKDLKDINLKRSVTMAELPANTFEMQYLDLKEGLDKNEKGEQVYFTAQYNPAENYTITMTNPAFTYNAQENAVYVNPGSEPQQDGEMIITWKAQKGAFFAKPLQRRIKLHWDNLRDGYYIVFNTSGGSTVPMLHGKYQLPLTAPAAPTKTGYTFAGWYSDAALTTPYTVPAAMPNTDTVAYAKWDPAPVRYTVEHYLEQANGSYEKNAADTLTALTGETVTPPPAAYTGFASPAAQTALVSADGATTLRYYYQRASYAVRFLSDGEEVLAGSYRYGTTLPKPAVAKPGYDFVGWAAEEGGTTPADVPAAIPAQELTYYAIWRPSENTQYTTRYYQQNTNDDGYTLSTIQPLTAKTETEVTAAALDGVTGFHLKEGTSLPSGRVAAAGSLVLRVYYDRDTFTLHYNSNGGTLADTSDATARWGAKVSQRVPTRTGYAFLGWYTDEALKNAFNGIMTQADLQLYAKWEAQKVNYTVEHWQQKADGSGEYTLANSELLSAPADSAVTPAVKAYTGFTPPAVREVTVQPDGTTVVRYDYARNRHTLTYVYNDGRENQVQEALFEAAVTAPATRTGYLFGGWYDDAALTNKFAGGMPDADLTLYAQWTPDQVAYRVEHRQQRLDGSYSTVETENLKALADSEVEPAVREYEGFTAPAPAKTTVAPDGTTVIAYEYTRNRYDLTLVLYEGAENIARSTLYGATIDDTPTRDKYAFAGWYTDAEHTQPFTGTMPAAALTLYANWEENRIPYTVKHLWQSLADPAQYELHETENFTAEEDVAVTPALKAYEGFTAPETQTVTPDLAGGTVVEYRYTRNSYDIHYLLNGGEGAESGSLPYGSAITAAPTRMGYAFEGWYREEALETAFAGTMPAAALTLYAKWAAKTVAYTVEHTQQNANNDEFTLKDRETFNEKTDASVTPAVKTYEGFTAPATQTVTVAGDGGTIVKYEYLRHTNTLTLQYLDGRAEETRTVRFGAAIPAPAARPGYTFDGWYTEAAKQNLFSATMPDAPLTLYAGWTANMVNYKVEHYLQTTGGDYTLAENDTQTLSALTDTEVTPAPNSYAGFIAPAAQTVKVSGDGSTVVKYSYDRGSFTLTVTPNNGTAATGSTVKYGAALNLAQPAKTGYTFKGWYTDINLENALEGDTMPAGDLNLYAGWTPNMVGYKVEHYQESLTGSYTLVNSEQKTALADSTVTPQTGSYTGFTAPAAAATAVAPDGGTVVRYNYTRNSYTLTFRPNNGGADQVSRVKYGAAIAAPGVSRNGYTLTGWGTTVESTMPAHDLSYTAAWRAISYTIGYNLNGGYVANQTGYTVESGPIALNRPTRSGYTFAGWTGTGLSYATVNVTIPAGSTGNRYYTANWAANTYTIYYSDPWGLIGSYSKNYSYGTGYNMDGSYAYGCTFNGWARTSTGGVYYTPGRWFSNLLESGSMNLYAKWTANNSYTGSTSGPFRVKDEGRNVKFHFYISGNTPGVGNTLPSSDTSSGPHSYSTGMAGLSYPVIAKSYSKMKITVSYTAEEIEDGWCNLAITARNASNTNQWPTMVSWMEVDDASGSTFFSHSYEISCSGGFAYDAICLEFSASGGGFDDDDWNITDLRVVAQFS